MGAKCNIWVDRQNFKAKKYTYFCSGLMTPLLGGVGGSGRFTLKNVNVEPMSAGTNHTIFIKGISSGVDTNIGVKACPRTRPIGFDRPRTVVAKIL